MPLPPLGEAPLRETLPVAFNIMEQLNKQKSNSRIENLSFNEMKEVNRNQFKFYLKSWDYLYQRTDLVRLRGNLFKGKRWACNRFIKQNQFDYRPFASKDIPSCLALFDRWKTMRNNVPCDENDPYYHDLLEDIRVANKRIIEESESLGILGRVVTIGSEIKGYIFGFELNESTCVVLSEITELSIKGLAQYIFRQYCDEFKKYQWINTMDDSSLPGLRRVKESYHPTQCIPSFTLTRL